MPEPELDSSHARDTCPPMEYRQLGQTDLKLSVMGFGASPLGGVFGETDAEEANRSVHYAIDEGINFFDVSPYYGLTLAEERLGDALRGKRDKVVLSTKCGRYGADEFDFSSERVGTSVEESLRRLQTDYVDLLQVHDVEFGSVEQIVNETLPALRRLQQEGKTRYVGISGYPLKVLLEVAQKAPVDNILTYCRYNLLVNDLDTVLAPAAQQLGIGMINASPLHMGLLSGQAPPSWHPAPPGVRQAADAALAFCREHDISLTDLALRFCFDYPRVASTLVGMSTTDQVRQNLHAYRTVGDPERLRQVKAILAPASNCIWSSGRPENQ